VIALFDEPYRITINQPEAAAGSRNGLLLGVLNGETFQGIVLLEDGSVTQLDSWMWTIDYRYEVESDRWMDVNRPEADQQP
jgi:hypothetical protein